ncbi:MAG: ABC transporter permease, partial [Bacteroidota bacterium]|nr:ABC transporter permease [Bacteroidota bacterium]
MNKIVIKVLKELDLYEIKDLKVGSPLKKFISGGQRKRLNIALELIRKPSILFADEPTSGLSSSDSEIVMSLFKDLTYKGKLVFVNIHQPSSDIYKLFDKIIIIDKGGYPVFYGNPVDAVVYFRKENKIANADDAICSTCGNINPEQVLDLVENKVVNEFGKLTNKRKFTPKKLYSLYNEHQKDSKTIIDKSYTEKQTLPKIMFDKASSIQQFIIFSTRNIIRKITNFQYILINLLEAPVLALILAFFSKYIKGTLENPNMYIFSENVNLPSFLFMAVTVALFMGLTVSAEEIIKDRRILRREKFLHLSHWAYLNSKIVFLFLLSGIQTFLFVIISNYVLEIHGLTFKFWIILFSAAFWGNIVGLLISSSLNSVVTIYISIPLILIPLLLFSGTIIDFTKLNKNFINEKYTPVIGDLMVSRWAFEALMVTQYTDNLYQKHFFDVEQKLENATYYSTTYYDRLDEIVKFLIKNKDNEDKVDIINKRFIILNHEIRKIEHLVNVRCPNKMNISKELFDESVADELMK